MLCKIADLLVDVPASGGMDVRCQEYLYHGNKDADIIINEKLYRSQLYPENWSENNIAYMESGYQFYTKLVAFGGFMLHASAVAMDGRAYLFSGPPGRGKSTHTRLWQQVFGEAAQVINDDKPALRNFNGEWYAYGTPWCGKDGINQNKKVSLAGICFLKQAGENCIRRMSRQEAINMLMYQTAYKMKTVEDMDFLLGHIDSIVRSVPIFELENKPEAEAVMLSYETMRRSGAGESVL